jgi:nucleotide-binding universal stress UspA family protein
MLSPIVVPLDGSLLAERALGPAKVLALGGQRELVLVRVINPAPELMLMEPGIGAVYPNTSATDHQREASIYLDSLRLALAKEDLVVHTLLRIDESPGEVASALVEVAREVHGGLIVMSSHGYAGIRRWILGSVAEGVLKAAPCPVLLIRAPMAAGHVLVTLDGSSLAEQILAPALAVARALQARLTLLRVIPAIRQSDVSQLETIERGMGSRFVDETFAEADAYLQDVISRYDDRTVAISTLVRCGPAAETIIDFVEQQHVDLVAMTTHGRTGLSRWLYGSVTHKVLSQLPISMLIARSAQVNLN